MNLKKSARQKAKYPGGWRTCSTCGKKCQRKITDRWVGYCGWCYYAYGPGSY